MDIYTGTVLIFNGPDVTDINKVGAAMGRGPESFIRKLTETNPPLWNSTVSGWFAYQVGGLSVFSMWNELVGTLPTEDDNGNPIVWEDWGLTEETAQAALDALNVFGYTSTDPQFAFIDACAAAMDPVQYVVPSPPV